MNAQSRQTSDVSTRVRPATPTDCPDLAVLHAATLPHGFFVELGPRFLGAYHRSFVDSPFACGHVVTLGGRVVGGLCGPLDSGAHWRWVMRRRGARLAGWGLLGVARHPSAGVRFARTRTGRYLSAVGRAFGRQTAAAAGRSTERVAVLTHVFVDPDLQGRGLGSALVDVFLADARAARASKAALVTLAGDAGAGRFYLRHGWTHEDDRLDQDGRSVSVYTRTLP